MVGVGDRSERVKGKKNKESQHLKRKMGEQKKEGKREEEDGEEKTKKNKSTSIFEA